MFLFWYGKIIIATLKQMMAAALGSTVEGTYAEVRKMSKEKLTKEQTISLIRGFKTNIKYNDFPERWHENPDVFKEALKKGMSLDEASEKLKDNESVVLEAIILQNPLYYASERLRDDKNFIMRLMKLEIFKFELFEFNSLSERIRDDYDIVLEFVKKDPFSLIELSEKFQNKKELLELVEKEDIKKWHPSYNNWYQERMEVLANIREKELMEKNFSQSNKKVKKLKF